MPPETFHVNKAERNERFYDACRLASSTYKEWAVIVLFYACVHYVDAVLCGDALLDEDLQNPIDHLKRNQAVAKCASLTPISTLYMSIYHRSIEVRYKDLDCPPKLFSTILTGYYSPIRKHIRGHLGLRNS